MKQFGLFQEEKNEDDISEYTSKITTPIYKPRAKKPHILELVNPFKPNKLVRDIKNSTVSDAEKKFLIYAAMRHNQFHYENIADYYAQASKEMQELMEASALVIIDFKTAIHNGYINLTNEIAELYGEEHAKEHTKESE